MIEVKVFNITDLESFVPKFEYEDLNRDMTKNLVDLNKTMLTLWKDGEVVCVTGVTKHREGVGELWLLPSKYVDCVKFEFYKAIKCLIYGFVFHELNYHRLEIAIREGWEQGVKWAKSLGFDFSHLCDGYDVNYTNCLIFKKVL